MPLHHAETRNTRWLVWLVRLTLLSAYGTVSASVPNYPDLETTSPDGRYRLDAKSPDNAGGHTHPMAMDFVYTLRDTTTDRILWTRTQPQDEGSPRRVFLHDDMWVVVRTGRERLMVLESVTGRKTFECSILDTFPVDERDAYVLITTAGPMWSRRSRWDFVNLNDHLYFVIRAWWDRRVIIDLPRARRVTNPRPDLISACDAANREYVIQTLDGPANRIPVEDWRNRHAERERWLTAIHLAGRMHIAEAVPGLRRLEESGSIGRQDVRLALRKLGEEPRELPMPRNGIMLNNRVVHLPPLPTPRAERTGLVKSGQSHMEVLKAIGNPDFTIDGAWEYDMDTDEPFTLRVHWDPLASVVTRCEKIIPALWQQGNTRYLTLVH